MSLNWNNKADEISWLREEIVHLKRALDEAQSWHLDYDALLQSYNAAIINASKVGERKRIVEHKVDMLNEQLNTAYADLTAADDKTKYLALTNGDLAAECARRRNENKTLRATLDDAQEEIQQRNEEIAALKRYLSRPASSRVEHLEEENARLEADNAQLYEAAQRATTIRKDTSSLRGQLAKVEHDLTLARADIDVYQQIAKQHNKMASAMATENNNLKADLAAERNRQHALWSAEWDALENALTEKIAVLEAENAKLVSFNEQDAISVDYLRRYLFNANATIAAVKKAVK